MTRRAALLVLGAAAAAAAAAGPTYAQCRLCEEPTTMRDEQGAGAAISLQIEAGLDFDRLILLAPGAGSAILRPNGSHQVTGTVGAISPRAMVGQARVRGEPGRIVRIELPDRIELHSLSGGRILIDEVATDLPSVARLDSAGILSFRFGGRLLVTGDAEGEYRGDVAITVDYL